MIHLKLPVSGPPNENIAPVHEASVEHALEMAVASKSGKAMD